MDSNIQERALSVMVAQYFDIDDAGDSVDSLGNLPEIARQFIVSVVDRPEYSYRMRRQLIGDLVAEFDRVVVGAGDDDQSEQLSADFVASLSGSAGEKILKKIIRKARKHTRPTWRKILSASWKIAAVLFICWCGLGYYLITGEPVSSDKYIRQLNELARAGRPETDNARALYESAGESWESFDPDLSEVYDLVLAGEAMTDQQRALADEWVQSNKDLWEIACQASQQKAYWGNYTRGEECEYISSPSTLVLMRFCIYGSYTGRLALADGHIDEALDICLTLFKIARHQLDSSLLLIEKMVAYACVEKAKDLAILIATDSRISPGQCQDLLAAIDATLAGMDVANESMEGELLFALDSIQQCYSEGGLFGGHILYDRIQPLCEIFQSEDVTGIRAFALAVLTAPLQCGRRQVEEFNIDNIKTMEELYKLPPYDALLRDEASEIQLLDTKCPPEDFFVNGPEMLRNMNANIHGLLYARRSSMEAARCILKFQQYYRIHSRYPKSLDELVADGSIPEVPRDPFNSGPLEYRVNEDTFTLYSIGWDYEDDNGHIDGDGVGVDNLGDLVFWPLDAPSLATE